MIERPPIYNFEEITEDLPRPPMAALRALLSIGIIVSPRGWQALPVEVRQTLAREGARERVGEDALKAALKSIPVSFIKLIPKTVDIDPSVIPTPLTAAVGTLRPLSLAEWGSLRPLDRHVLVALAQNTRLLGRALDEILPRNGASESPIKRWSAAVARCEVHIRRDVLQRILGTEFQGGRAFVLARVAGRRAARRVAEIFDLHSESTVGPIELDFGVRDGDSVVFWQAHVSAWDGSFFPTAALLAATTAAIALHDMAKELDPDAKLSPAGIREEPWQAGREEMEEPATAVFNAASLLAQGDAEAAGRSPVLAPERDPAASAGAADASGPHESMSARGRTVAQIMNSTIMTGPPVMDEALPPPWSTPSKSPAVPAPPSSTPVLVQAIDRPARALAKGPSARMFVVVSVVAILAVAGLIALAIGFAHSAGRF